MSLILNRLQNMDKQNIFEIKKKDRLKQIDYSTYILKINSNTFLIANSLIDFLKRKEKDIKILEVTLEEVSRLIEKKLSKNYEFMGIYNPNFPKLIN
ncbi:hypothetical protein NON08_13370 [Cetobacterium somerae]|uniref:hypothetical protein n=1 Tax=Cetobacterium sp. NK01 TaxID=2993530 RepID=UPI002116184F|nr:hypothetical protein [Cetobacterium sp. NK01]MCQ8213491.1 hypothetical protein [Cetobacterium sp. NK01]